MRGVHPCARPVAYAPYLRTVPLFSPVFSPRFLVLVGLVALPASAQQRDASLPRLSPSASVSQTFGVTTATVTYGRPSIKGRPVFAGDGSLAPLGQVWRAGADEASTVTFTTPVRVEGRSLGAGTYGLFAVPGTAAWTVVFNAVPNQWGAFTYDASKDALRVDVTPTPTTGSVEQLHVTFEAATDTSATLVLAWDGLRVPVRLAADTYGLLEAQGDMAAAEATDWRVPFRYANWALAQNRLLDAGQRWSARALALDANFSTLRLAALYAAARADYPTALRYGQDALALGRTLPTPPQGLADFERRVQAWHPQR